MEKLLAHRDAPLPSLVKVLTTARSPGVNPRLLSDVDAIFQSMIAKQPADRFASMTKVIAALSAISDQSVNEPTAPFGPMFVPPTSATSTHADPVLAALMHSSDNAARMATRPAVLEATPANATDVPTVLTAGAVQDTATTQRQSYLPRARRKISLWTGAVAALVIGVGMIWLAVQWFNRPQQELPSTKANRTLAGAKPNPSIAPSPAAGCRLAGLVRRCSPTRHCPVRRQAGKASPAEMGRISRCSSGIHQQHRHEVSAHPTGRVPDGQHG